MFQSNTSIFDHNCIYMDDISKQLNSWLNLKYQKQWAMRLVTWLETGW